MKNLIYLGLFGILAITPKIQSQEKPNKPFQKPMNVLFIAVDDLRPELGCYGNTTIKSPNIDALAASSITFDRAYCQQAICMASRASILTGMSPETRSIYACGSVNESYPEQDKLDDLFRNNGYDVRAFGKIYHHKSDHKKQFGKRWVNENPASKEKGRGYLDPESIAVITDDAGRGPAFESPEVPDEAYLDGFLANEASTTLAQLSRSSKPFFLAIGFHKPHLPFNAPQKYWDLYADGDLQLASNQQLPENYVKETKYNFGELRNYVGIPSGDSLLPRALQKELMHGYYASVSYVDAQIGKVLQQLNASGLDKNTIVVLWGDHGWKLGEHGMWCKHTNFELDTRVPLIIRVPGMKHARAASFVELIDLYPTLAELCGLKAPDVLQGKSLLPVMQYPKQHVREEAYSLYPHARDNDKKLVMGYTVVNDRYRYINWMHIATGISEGQELYDHDSDPEENRNIAGEEENATVIKKMDALLHQRFKMDASILEE